MAGIYIHIPFCHQACHYCDFHFSTNQKLMVPMIDAIETELVTRNDYLNLEPIKTIYFGGGTPSLINASGLDRILNTIHKYYDTQLLSEVTLEANPDNINNNNLSDWHNLGVNRLSVGIQSFNDDVLKFLNRSHDSKAALKSLDEISKSSFSNYTMDLIYGIPGLNAKGWNDTLKITEGLNPPHLSSYALTIEPRTVFGHRLEKGNLKAVDDDLVTAQYETLVNWASRNGYEHYEVSNFSRPGFISQHNSSYWKGIKYLGVGPSSHSYDGESRQINISNNAKYIKLIQSNSIYFEEEHLDNKTRVIEYLITTSRTKWGIDLNKLKREFGVYTKPGFNDLIKKSLEEELLSVDNSNISLTDKGKFIADEFVIKFLDQIDFLTSILVFVHDKMD